MAQENTFFIYRL